MDNVRKIIVGKDFQIRQALTCWLARGHLLIEDVPGTGKTLLARAISCSVNVPFNRVQFTPDLLPGDIVGSSIYRPDLSQFEFIQGPLFTTVLLADEINRATPRTQSALLEAMSEGQITSEGRTFKLDELFFAIATQNPIDQLGTFPLAEAQLDRFLMKISMGYPDPKEEFNWLRKSNFENPIQYLKPVVDYVDWKWLMDQVSLVHISDEIYQYLMTFITRTRQNKNLKIGASPRAALALKKSCQALALIEGQSFVTPEHLNSLISPVLSHRLIPTIDAKLSDRDSTQIIEEIKTSIVVPLRKSG